ncbi:ABC transporter substrate-binding protein [Virgisporangium ochraceum]|uniref:Amino acid ABC transporter n=1 Tax=Virgisporangium ochraceum TaxID=65505 RepID=A0A8J4EEU7_9ACTN|nr:transporter substrate-binding domain-containing protein [Virgisporangium ochraceum]GIJ72970.1 amino acid ABC transporter [Virgisporangium ochraceum]
MRRLSAVLALLLATTVLSACNSDPEKSPGAAPAAGNGPVKELVDRLPEAIRKAGVLRLAGDSHPPYRSVGTDGKTVTGLDPDLQAALGRVLGLKPEISIVNGLPAALTGMLSGRYDGFNGPVKDTAEREKDFDAVVWMTTRTAYLVPTESKAGIRTSADICGKKVAAVTGSIVEDQIKKLTAWCTKNGKQAVTFIGLADTNATILAAKSGRADAAGMTEGAAIDAKAKDKDAYTYVTQTDEQGAGVDQLAMLVPKSSGLGPVLRDAFTVLLDSGEYLEIMKKYGLDNVAVKQIGYNTAAPKTSGPGSPAPSAST